MKKNTDKWIETILDSTKGSGRVKPSAQVWKNVEQHLFNKESHLVSIKQWRIAIVAAVFLMVLNIFSIRNYAQNTADKMNAKDMAKPSIISNYQLYD